MKPITVFQILLLLTICQACTSNSKQTETVILDLEPIQNSNQINADYIDSSYLKHIVFLNIKPEMDLDSLIVELSDLAKIKSIRSFIASKYKDMGDPKAMSNYELILDMTFKNEEAYRSYQADSLHVAMINKAKSYMEGPPLSYDYMIE